MWKKNFIDTKNLINTKLGRSLTILFYIFSLIFLEQKVNKSIIKKKVNKSYRKSSHICTKTKS
jgi:hypothetical protein